jgi:hypothetical protein
MTDTLRTGDRPDRGHLTAGQIKRMLTPVRADRLEKKQNLTYVPQQEVRAELIRTFGPGRTDHTMHDIRLLYETRIVQGDVQYPKTGKAPEYWVVGYMVGCTLRAYDYDGYLVYECTEYHAEENAPQPNRGEAHALALTSCESYALRRAALNLGDNMGLHLYSGGSTAPLVMNTMALVDEESPLHAQRPSKPSESPAQASGTARLRSEQDASQVPGPAISSPEVVQSAERMGRLQGATNVRQTTMTPEMEAALAGEFDENGRRIS